MIYIYIHIYYIYIYNTYFCRYVSTFAVYIYLHICIYACRYLSTDAQKEAALGSEAGFQNLRFADGLQAHGQLRPKQSQEVLEQAEQLSRGLGTSI